MEPASGIPPSNAEGNERPALVPCPSISEEVLASRGRIWPEPLPDVPVNLPASRYGHRLGAVQALGSERGRFADVATTSLSLNQPIGSGCAQGMGAQGMLCRIPHFRHPIM
jgi:hypothetical protein